VNDHDQDHDLQLAYDRLGSALEPPRDAEARIGRRIVVRRRRRRVALAGVAALAVVGGTGAAVALGGAGGPGDTPVATDPGTTTPASTLVLTRPDGSTYAFDDVTVSCDPPTTTAGDPMGQGRGRIWLTSPIEVTGSEDAGDLAVQRPFVYVEVRVAAFDEPRTLTLPVDGPGDSESYPATVFVADPAAGSGGAAANEVSSAVGGDGTVRVLRASCDPIPVLELEVDASLGSEVDGPELRLTGTYR
jgi:hypothetical protein